MDSYAVVFLLGPAASKIAGMLVLFPTLRSAGSRGVGRSLSPTLWTPALPGKRRFVPRDDAHQTGPTYSRTFTKTSAASTLTRRTLPYAVCSRPGLSMLILCSLVAVQRTGSALTSSGDARRRMVDRPSAFLFFLYRMRLCVLACWPTVAYLLRLYAVLTVRSCYYLLGRPCALFHELACYRTMRRQRRVCLPLPAHTPQRGRTLVRQSQSPPPACSPTDGGGARPGRLASAAARRRAMGTPPPPGASPSPRAPPPAAPPRGRR